MSDKIRISTSELNAQATELSKLHGQINDIYQKADKALNLMNEALSAKFVLTMWFKKVTLLAKLATLRKSLNDGANVAIQCAETYENADKVLRDLMGNSLPNDIIQSPISNQEVYKGNGYSVSELETMFATGQKVDIYSMDNRINYTDSYGNAKGYYVFDNGCTWYAAARYRQVNEQDIDFSIGGGNANQWANNIDKNSFNINATSNQTTIVSNSIGIDVNGGYGFGHVVYVEAVSNGYVYYSEGSWGGDVSEWGKIKKVTISEFANTFEYTASAK